MGQISRRGRALGLQPINVSTDGGVFSSLFLSASSSCLAGSGRRGGACIVLLGTLRRSLCCGSLCSCETRLEVVLSKAVPVLPCATVDTPPAEPWVSDELGCFSLVFRSSHFPCPWDSLPWPRLLRCGPVFISFSRIPEYSYPLLWV